MPLSISNESKNNLIITNDAKSEGYIFEGRNSVWNEETGTWDNPDLTVSPETKNNLTITNETKL